MAEISTSTWNETAASNTASPPDGAPEGMAPSGTNDWMRETQAVLKREWNRSHPTVSSATSTTAFTLTYTTAPTAYAQGLMFAFKVHAASTGSVTLNVNALGAKKVYRNISGTATQVASGEWQTNDIVLVSYDTTLDSAAGGFWWVNAPATGITPSFVSTDAGAAEGPTLDLYRDSASPAANDVLAGIQFNGRDSAANKQTYGRIKTTITTATSGSEASTVTLSAFAAGAETDALAVGGSGVLFNSAGAFRGEISGLTLSNNGSDATNDIDIAVGSAAADATPWGLMALTGALTKQLDASWAVGTNAGMRATGAAIANGTYHIFLIRRPDTGVVDIAADTSATGANITANTASAYTQFRRIGSILRESAAIVGFVQNGDLFMRKSPLLDITAATPGSSAVTRTLLVPTGIVVEALINFSLSGTTNDFAYFSSLSQTDVAASNTGAPLAQGGIAGAGVTSLDIARIITNTSGQIRSRLLSGAAGTLYISSQGWVDRRGRDD